MILTSLKASDAGGDRIEVRRLTAGRVRRTAFRILKNTPLCAIATVADDGPAHVNTAYFAYTNDLELDFLSHPQSLHCRNIRLRPRIAIAVFESDQCRGELDRGLQRFGMCRETRGAAARRAARIYGARFKPYSEWRQELEAADEGSEYRFYRFTTRRLKLFDEREFGGAIFVSASVRTAGPATSR